ncbi:MAG TPA: gamma-glutamyltransferase [Roseiflexaceae bacterium]|nr:gamma-glutamyltransferase [Roseiflexaceae bacterium]
MRGMIAAAEPVAAEAGARVLQQGGNAVDAAIAAAFVQMIVNPQMCGLGGYALITLRLAGEPAGRTLLLDAPALAGSRTSAAMWVDHVIRPNPDGWGYFLKGKVNDMGYQAICTPGTVRGLATILARWGTIGWAQALEPAIQVADEGFMVDSQLATRWKTRSPYPEGCSLLDYIMANAEARRIYLTSDGIPYDEGQILRNPDYARTLRHLAAHGADDFYTGELAERMISDLAANAGFVTADDLAHYQVRDEAPTLSTFHGYTIASSQAPHGGPTLAAILNILEGYDLAALGHNSAAYILLVSMAMKAAFADRNRWMGDPAADDVPTNWMISKERAAEWRALIDSGTAISVDALPHGPPSTTHVCVVDAAGNCVSLTHSLGMSSGVITPGLGFMYNNSMINFNPLPGHRNSIAPGKGRTTGMAPTIVYQNDQPILVVGAPGASRIITGVLQVILNRLVFGMSPVEAVYAARFDCQGDRIVVQNRIPEYICEEIRRTHPVVRIPQSHGAISLVQAIAIDPSNGALSGASDTGNSGMALLV